MNNSNKLNLQLQKGIQITSKNYAKRIQTKEPLFRKIQTKGRKKTCKDEEISSDIFQKRKLIHVVTHCILDDKCKAMSNPPAEIPSTVTIKPWLNMNFYLQNFRN